MSKADNDIVEMLETPVKVKRLVDKLFFNIDDIETAAIKQPSLYLESGRFRAQMALRSASYKRKLSRLTGKKSGKIRKNSDIKTEGAIKTKLSVDSELQALQKKVDETVVYEDFAKQLQEAYKERLMVIAVLTRLRASEISSELRHVKGQEEKDKLRHRAQKMRDTFEGLEDEDE